MISAEDVAGWLRRAADKVTVHRDELTQLDAAIGDADHGANLHRGLQAVVERLEGQNLANSDVGSIGKDIGMALISSVGGASGPLYGTFFLRFGAALVGQREVHASEFAAAFRAGVEGIRQRGKAELGDKTMLDVLLPASQALESALAEHLSLGDALRLAACSAREGMLSTRPLIARKGRASYLGERSRGHQDPGATSAYLIVQAAAESFCGER